MRIIIKDNKEDEILESIRFIFTDEEVKEIVYRFLLAECIIKDISNCDCDITPNKDMCIKEKISDDNKLVFDINQAMYQYIELNKDNITQILINYIYHSYYHKILDDFDKIHHGQTNKTTIIDRDKNIMIIFFIDDKFII